MKRLWLAGLGMMLSLTASARTVSFEAYIDAFKQQAEQAGISHETVEAAFRDVTYRHRTVVADKNQPEKKLTLDEYIPRAVPDWKVKKAKKLYRQHYAALQQVSREYGVQPQYIVALWGVESNFGALTGRHYVMSALATLAYDGRREAFFRKEMMAALKIIEDDHIDPHDMKGSWAGAMGQCQFMPSSFLTFAVDGNHDGKIDIWKTKADVFASTANYLHRSGWDNQYRWGRQVHLPRGFDMSLEGRHQGKAKTLREWRRLGVTRYNGQPLPAPAKDIKAWLVAPDDEKGRAYLIYNNYNVLMKWNRSHYFALAVSHLADRIVSR
ncbi:Membrane-bound lytic murein transglycosylase B precursor [Vibrio aerogenes CECT 7868]|uniref:Membrane-bound lytic murein transglycosylase B n=1 Tax=Vibrio aerogenes CECT 7868 TaxID=1216006 RepID=A0A1M6BPW7_9VIBR|nr:lytic murein transglycosylase [Vibrio aerogenes]SHI50742.1 Membrane-bound lytic murein transglycosylase B precursor [Vibrio aerogenes CECT 7868]